MAGPGVEGVLLLGLVITTPTRHHMQSARLRALIVGLVGLVSLTTLISLILLARFLLDGSHARGHALLFAGAVLWLTNVLIFGIWYWELDRGGPAHAPRPERREHACPTSCSRRWPSRSSRPAGGRLRRLPVHLVHERDRLQPNRHAAAQRDGEAADGDPVVDRADHDPARGRARGQRARLTVAAILGARASARSPPARAPLRNAAWTG